MSQSNNPFDVLAPKQPSIQITAAENAQQAQQSKEGLVEVTNSGQGVEGEGVEGEGGDWKLSTKKKKRKHYGKSVRDAVKAGRPLDSVNKREYHDIWVKQQGKGSGGQDKAHSFKNRGRDGRKFSPYARHDGRSSVGKDHLNVPRPGPRGAIPWLANSEAPRQTSLGNVHSTDISQRAPGHQEKASTAGNQDREELSTAVNKNIETSQGNVTGTWQIESQSAQDSSLLLSLDFKLAGKQGEELKKHITIALPHVEQKKQETVKQVEQHGSASVAGMVKATTPAASIPKLMKAFSSPARQPEMRESAMFLPTPITGVAPATTSYIHAFPELEKKEKPVMEGRPAVQSPPFLRQPSSSQAAKSLKSSPLSRKDQSEVSDRSLTLPINKKRSATKSPPRLVLHSSSVSMKDAGDLPVHSSDVSMADAVERQPATRSVSYAEALKQQTSSLGEMSIDDYQPDFGDGDRLMSDTQTHQYDPPRLSKLEQMVGQVVESGLSKRHEEVVKHDLYIKNKEDDKFAPVTDEDLQSITDEREKKKWSTIAHFANSKTRWNKMAKYLLTIKNYPEKAHTIIRDGMLEPLEAEAVVRLAPSSEQPNRSDPQASWIDSGTIQHALEKFYGVDNDWNGKAIITNPAVASVLMQGENPLDKLNKLYEDNKKNPNPTYFGYQLPLRYNEVHFPYWVNRNHYVAVRIVPDVDSGVGRIEVRDSMGGSNIDEDILKKLADLIAQDQFSPMHKVRLWEVTYPDCPRQANWSDCGPLTVSTMMALISEAELPRNMSKSDQLRYGDQARWEIFRQQYIHVIEIDPEIDQAISPGFVRQQARASTQAQAPVMPKPSDRLPPNQRRTGSVRGFNKAQIQHKQPGNEQKQSKTLPAKHAAKKTARVVQDTHMLPPDPSMLKSETGHSSQKSMKEFPEHLSTSCTNCIRKLDANAEAQACSHATGGILPCSACIETGHSQSCRLPGWDEDQWGYHANPTRNLYIMLSDILQQGPQTLQALANTIRPLLPLETFKHATADQATVESLIHLLMERCSNTFQQVSEGMDGNDPNCIWSIVAAFGKAIPSATLAALQSPRSDLLGPFELEDDLDAPYDFVIFTSRTSWGWANNEAPTLQQQATDDFCDIYHSRFSTVDNEDLVRINSVGELKKALEDDKLPWTGFLPNPVSSQNRFLERRDEQDKVILDILAHLSAEAEKNDTHYSVLVAFVGFDCLTTNNNSWQFMVEHFPQLDFRLTIAVPSHAVPYTGHGRTDASWNGTWFHYDLSYLAELMAFEQNIHLCPRKQVEEQWLRSSNNIASHPDDCELCATEGIFSAENAKLLLGEQLTRESIDQFFKHYSLLSILEIINVYKAFIGMTKAEFATKEAVLPYNQNFLATQLTRSKVRSALFGKKEDFIRECKFCKKTDTELERADESSVEFKCKGGCDEGLEGIQVSNDELTDCPVCHDKIKAIHIVGHLMKHVKHVPGQDYECPVSTCAISSKKHKKLSGLRGHLHLVHNVNRFGPCPGCGARFRSKAELDEHLKTEHPDLMYTCSVGECDNLPVSYAHKHNLNCHRAHFGLLTDEDQKARYRCPRAHCARGFKTAHDRDVHVSQAHDRKLKTQSKKDQKDTKSKKHHLKEVIYCWDGVCAGAPIPKDQIHGHQRLFHLQQHSKTPQYKNDGLHACNINGCGRRFKFHRMLVSHNEQHRAFTQAGIELHGSVNADRNMEIVEQNVGEQEPHAEELLSTAIEPLHTDQSHTKLPVADSAQASKQRGTITQPRPRKKLKTLQERPTSLTGVSSKKTSDHTTVSSLRRSSRVKAKTTNTAAFGPELSSSPARKSQSESGSDYANEIDDAEDEEPSDTSSNAEERSLDRTSSDSESDDDNDGNAPAPATHASRVDESIQVPAAQSKQNRIGEAASDEGVENKKSVSKKGKKRKKATTKTKKTQGPIDLCNEGGCVDFAYRRYKLTRHRQDFHAFTYGYWDQEKDGDAEYKCHIEGCQRGFEKEGGLAIHIGKHQLPDHVPSTTVTYCQHGKCKEHGVSFQQFHQDRHDRTWHRAATGNLTEEDEAGEFKCPEADCGRGFKSRGRFDDHVGKHHFLYRGRGEPGAEDFEEESESAEE